MNILGIETSCDETAAAVIADGRLVRSNVVASQIQIHARYGGVVPEVASRQHMITILPVIEQAIGEAGIEWREVDGVAVTNGPGLAGALLVGVNVAKTTAFARGLPLLGVNHLEGHIYANWLVDPADLPPGGGLPPPPSFPLLCLIVSGGHTDLLLMAGHGDYRRIGSTLDDAAGEAFDKVARLLGLGYPGGPAIQSAAVNGDPNAFRLPRAWLRGTHDFSFSGLKTAALHAVRQARAEQGLNEDDVLPPSIVAHLAASFQAAVVDVLVAKTVDAAKAHGVGQVVVAGGVAANGALRAAIEAASPLPVAYPKLAYCTDNAAMIAAAGDFHLRRGRVDGWDMDVHANWELTARTNERC